MLPAAPLCRFQPILHRDQPDQSETEGVDFVYAAYVCRLSPLEGWVKITVVSATVPFPSRSKGRKYKKVRVVFISLEKYGSALVFQGFLHVLFCLNDFWETLFNGNLF